MHTTATLCETSPLIHDFPVKEVRLLSPHPIQSACSDIPPSYLMLRPELGETERAALHQGFKQLGLDFESDIADLIKLLSWACVSVGEGHLAAIVEG